MSGVTLGVFHLVWVLFTHVVQWASVCSDEEGSSLEIRYPCSMRIGITYTSLWTVIMGLLMCLFLDTFVSIFVHVSFQ